MLLFAVSSDYLSFKNVSSSLKKLSTNVEYLKLGLDWRDLEWKFKFIEKRISFTVRFYFLNDKKYLCGNVTLTSNGINK